MSVGIQLYNTLSGTKEPLETLESGKVRFYACGPTVYNRFHIGNARMFVAFDTIRRYLQYRGYEVRFVQNFTDVDDRIIHRANELGVDARSFADENIAAYFEDADALGIARADVHPRVTDCIPEIIQFISDLVDAGYAYEQSGNVYFDVSKATDYGKLSHQSLSDMQAGFRIEVNEEKRDAADFALWKAAKPGEEWWQSPFGKGRPGWHIECSVMNLTYLGEQIDIHAGGRDLVFPHHENEIVQSEAHSGKQFARYWLHNGIVNIHGEKMSKSLGNFILTRDLLEKRSARSIRYFLLSAHYRHPLNYSEDAMDQAEQGLARIDQCLRTLKYREQAIMALPNWLEKRGEPAGADVQEAVTQAREAFMKAMDDDFNTADGIAAIYEGVRSANSYSMQHDVTIGGLILWHDLITELLAVLGLADLDQNGRPTASEDASDDSTLLRVEALLDERKHAREKRDFARADEIRGMLEEQGIVIEDTAQGTRWYRK